MRWQGTDSLAHLSLLVFIVVFSLANASDRRKREIGGPGTKKSVDKQQFWYPNFEDFQKLTEPIFDNNTVTNQTAQLGSTAFLHCRVRNLGERTISWVRRRDWHILTSGLSTYTNDGRFEVVHTEGSDDWTLQIKYVQKRDNGTYECQVSTGNGILSHFVNLNIVVPKAFILGGSNDYYVDLGGPIQLVCVVEKTSDAQYVLWYHNNHTINYDVSRRYSVAVESDSSDSRTQSKLTIRDASEEDSGNYTCSAPNTSPSTVAVFVSEGDTMAAVSRRKLSNGTGGLDGILWFIILPLLNLLAK